MPPEQNTEHRPLKLSPLRSVQTKITLTLVLAVSLILAGFGLYNVNESRDRIEFELHQLAETTVQRLSQHIIGPFWALNDEQIAEQLDAAMLEPRIHAAIVRDRDRETIYMGRERDADWELQPATGTPDGNLITSRTTLVRDNGEMIGVLEIHVTRRFLEQQFNDLVIAEIGRGSLLALALVLVSIIMLRRVVVRPIRELTDAANLISAGQLNTPIPLRSRDEIGLLANSIAKLQTSLRIAIDRMKKNR